MQGPNPTNRSSGAAPVSCKSLLTAFETTRLQLPRQPACMRLTTRWRGATATTGKQSAVQIAECQPGVVNTMASPRRFSTGGPPAEFFITTTLSECSCCSKIRRWSGSSKASKKTSQGDRGPSRCAPPRHNSVCLVVKAWTNPGIASSASYAR